MRLTESGVQPRTGGTSEPDRGCLSNKNGADELATPYVGTYNVGKCNDGGAVRGLTVAARCATPIPARLTLMGSPDKEPMVQIQTLRAASGYH